MVGRKFLSAAIVAARITGVKGMKLMVEQPEDSVAVVLYGAAMEVSLKVKNTCDEFIPPLGGDRMAAAPAG